MPPTEGSEAERDRELVRSLLRWNKRRNFGRHAWLAAGAGLA